MSGTQLFEIPLAPVPLVFQITLAGTTRTMTTFYRDAPAACAGGAGWCLDIADEGNNPIVCGIPLVTGADLLAQYAYLDLGGQLWVRSDGDPAAVPAFQNLGQVPGGHLYWIPNPS